jgi:TolB-like protein/DNA-binding SARP family transcriptional activator
MAHLDVRLLGGFEIRLDSGQKITLSTRKAEALLAYLALAPGQARSREQLASLLWSDRADAQAKSSLRQALTALRRGLRENGSPVFATDGESVALDASTLVVDVLEFERLAGNGSNGNLARAEQLYQGPLLDGLNVRDPSFNEWLAQERARLHELAVKAVDRLLAAQLREGDHEAAIATAQRLLALDPLRESTYRTLMRLYAEQGQRALAAREFERCRDILAKELRIEPAPATRRLYEEIVSPARDSETTAEASSPPVHPLPLPAKPSVAVLPFANLSGDPEHGYLSDGLTEDVITELARFPDLFVIGARSSLALKDRAISPNQAARDLGVEYVVEGSVRKAGETLRVTVQLIDPATGHRLWAERYDRPFAEVFAIQDEIVGNIAGTLSVNIEQVRAARTRDRPPESLEVYDYYLRAKEAALIATREAHADARDLFQTALDLAPNYAPAWSGLAMVHDVSPCLLPGADLRESLDNARYCAEKALALDRTLPRAYLALGWAQLRSGEFDLARRNMDQALARSPNDPETLAIRAIALTFFGDFKGAVEVAELGLRMNPYAPDCYLFALQLAAFFTGRYEDGLAYSAQFAEPFAENLAWRAASHALLGNEESARREAEAFVRDYGEYWAGDPAAGPEDYVRWILRDANYFAHEEDRERLAEGLRLAGLPA